MKTLLGRLAVLVVACAFTRSVLAADWPQFLGPNRNGLSAETGLIDSWPEAGPKEVWRISGGVGMSGVAVGNGRAVTLVQKEDQQWLVAHDATTGKSLWETALGPEYKDRQGDGPRATPTIVDDAVVAFTGQGILVAANASDGKIVWSQNVIQKLGGKVADYGMASSPLVAGELVVVIAGTPQACVATLRLKTGELAWKSANGPAGYSSPVMLKVGGKEQLVVFNGNAIVGMNPPSGDILWRHEYETDYECNIAMPLAVNGQVFISSGENHGSALLMLKPQGGKFAVEEVWQSQGPQSVLRSEWQTPVLLDGYLYGLDNIGSAGPVTHLTCVKAETGERVWQQLRFGKSNLIAADGKLFFSTMTGELVVVRATPKGFEEIGRKLVIGPTRQAPALANGLLYLRDDKEIVCLNVRK